MFDDPKETPPDVPWTASRLETPDDIARAMHAECALLGVELASLKHTARKRILPKTATSLALLAGKTTGRQALSLARSKPLPFAAAAGGAAWLIASVIGKHSDETGRASIQGNGDERSSGHLLAAGLMIGAGILAGRSLRNGKKRG